jgi:hypothetical protein
VAPRLAAEARDFKWYGSVDSGNSPGISGSFADVLGVENLHTVMQTGGH